MIHRLAAWVALGVAVSALGIVALAEPSQPPAAATEERRAPSEDAASWEELEERIAALERSSTALSARLRALENRQGGPMDASVGQAPPALAQEVAQLRAQVRDLSSGLVLESESGRSAMKELVRGVQDELSVERQAAWQKRMTEFREQARAEASQQWKDFAKEKGLSYDQERQLQERLGIEESRREALMAQLQAGTQDPRAMRRELRTLRSETDEQMKGLLSETQFARYQEIRQEDRPGFGGRPGGGRSER